MGEKEDKKIIVNVNGSSVAVTGEYVIANAGEVVEIWECTLHGDHRFSEKPDTGLCPHDGSPVHSVFVWKN